MLTERPIMDLGVQPLDRILLENGWTNHTLVAASTEFITHKMVQRARKGRRLTRRTQEKVLRALNGASPGRAYQREELFNYNGS